MTPPARPRKMEVVKAIDGRLHISLGLGVAPRPVVLILIEGGSK